MSTHAWLCCFVVGDVVQFLYNHDVFFIGHCSPKAAVQDAFDSLGLKDYNPESVTKLYFEMRVSLNELKRMGRVGCYFNHARGVREGYITGPAPPLYLMIHWVGGFGFRVHEVL